ncbi:MAG: glycerol-3-phosphate acyltransferase [Candidatus Lokiarchaeota archaeon]|nr:glycerol-3-phosphate acyltransferase [Candidatus Lokiarchaeota archaeon]
MDFIIIIISSVLGYLLGSISFSRIFLKLLAPDKSMDELQLTLEESQDEIGLEMGAGANKASIILGTKYGVIIGILDMLKIILPLIVFRYILFPNQPYFLYLAAFGLVGHNWPIYHRFKGGRGQSVMLGSLIVIDWLGAILNLTFGILLAFSLFGSLILAFYLWLWMMIPWFIFRTFDINFMLYAIIVNIVIILGQIPELKLYFQLRKEGTHLEYKEKLLETTAQLRGMKKMEDKFLSMGKWRFVIGIIILLGLLTIYAFLPLISNFI